MPAIEGKCAVCRREFNGDQCQHTVSQHLEREEQNKQDNRLRKIVRQEIERYFKDKGTGGVQ